MRRTVLKAAAAMAMAATVASCGGSSDGFGPIDDPEEIIGRACGLAGPGVAAEFSGSGANVSTMGPYAGNIQRITAPTTTPNFISNSSAGPTRKFILILGGEPGTLYHAWPIGQGGTYLSFTDGSGSPAKVWVASAGSIETFTCAAGGVGFAAAGDGTMGTTAFTIPMTPAPQSAATGTLHVAVYGRIQ